MNPSSAKETHERAQQVIIGNLFWRCESAEDVFAAMQPRDIEAFSHPVLRRVMEAMIRLFEKDVRIDVPAVRREIKKGRPSLNDLMRLEETCEEAAHSENQSRELGSGPEDWFRVLREEYVTQKIKEGMGRAQSYEEVMSVIDHSMGLCRGPDESQRSMGELFDLVVSAEQDIREGRRCPGYSWGIGRLDDSILIQPGKLYCVGASKGSGKTKLLIHILEHNLMRVEEPVPCLFFSLEMGELDMGKYFVSRHVEIDSSLLLRTGLPDGPFDRIQTYAESFHEAPLEIDSSARLTLREITSRIRRWKRRHKIPEGTGLVGIDFLQRILVDNSQVSEATALRDVAYGLSATAKELGVAIVTLAQLNKQADGVRPVSRHIEGSGGVAQASDGVLLLDLVRLRDEEAVSDGEWDEMNVIMAKIRDGETGVSVPLRVNLRIGRFVNAAHAAVVPFPR